MILKEQKQIVILIQLYLDYEFEYKMDLDNHQIMVKHILFHSQ
jgi:hypothetical protein